MALNFPGLLGDPKRLQTSDFKSAGSHQVENINSAQLDAADTWTELVVVAANRTYYVSLIAISSTQASVQNFVGTGASASEVAFLATTVGALFPQLITFPTPLKFAPSTRISIRSSSASTAFFNLVGWVEA